MRLTLYLLSLLLCLACKKKELSEEQIENQKAEESILGYWQMDGLRFEAPLLASYAERENLLCANAFYLGVLDLLLYDDLLPNTLFFEPQKGSLNFKDFQDLSAKFTWSYNTISKKYMLDYAKFVGEDKKFFLQYDVSGRLVLLNRVQKMPACTYQAGRPVLTLQNGKPMYLESKQQIYTTFKKVRPYAR